MQLLILNKKSSDSKNQSIIYQLFTRLRTQKKVVNLKLIVNF
jgi:hypothetical protein